MKFHLSVLLTLLCFSTFGQATNTENAEIAFGPMFTVDQRSVPTKFVGSDESGFYVVYSDGKHGTGEESLYKFGYDLKPIRNSKLTMNIGGQMVDPQSVFMLNNKLYQIIRTDYSNIMNVSMYEIDNETLEIGKGLILAQMTSDSKRASRAALSVQFSDDLSKMVVIYTIPNKRKEFESIRAHVYDSDFKEIWSQTYELPYENRLLDIQDYTLHNDGKLFITARRFYGKRRAKVDGEVNYDYLLLSLEDNGKIDSLQIQSQDKYLRSMRVDVAENGDVVSAGFYSQRNSNGLGGAFYLRIDSKTGAQISSSYKEFDIDFQTDNMTEAKAARTKKRAAEGKNVEQANYFIDRFITKPDGGVQMIGEKRLIITTYIQAGLVVVPTTTYYFDDILVVDIDAEGQIKWASQIAKKQTTTDDAAAYSSYANLSQGSNLFFVFNDNAENLDYNGVGRVSRMGKNSSTVVMAAKVDENGKITREGLFRRGEAEIKIRPRLSHVLNDNEMLLFGHSTVRNQRFVLVKFK